MPYKAIFSGEIPLQHSGLQTTRWRGPMLRMQQPDVFSFFADGSEFQSLCDITALEL